MMSHIADHAPNLIAITGLSGSGKSTLCRHLTQILQAEGILSTHISSDVIRKNLYNMPITERLPKSAYDWPVTKKVIELMRRETISALKKGDVVLYDALLNHKKARQDVGLLARKNNVICHGFWLALPEDVIKKRIIERSQRGDDASDATLEILEQQLQNQTDVTDWPQIDATQDAVKAAQAIYQRVYK